MPLVGTLVREPDDLRGADQTNLLLYEHGLAVHRHSDVSFIDICHLIARQPCSAFTSYEDTSLSGSGKTYVSRSSGGRRLT